MMEICNLEPFVRYDDDNEPKCGCSGCDTLAKEYVYLTLAGMDCGRRFCAAHACEAREDERLYKIGL